MRRWKHAPPFSRESRLAQALSAAARSPLSPCFSSLLLCSVSLSFLILLHLYTRSLTLSGMHSYPLRLRQPQSHTHHCAYKQMQITWTKNSSQLLHRKHFITYSCHPVGCVFRHYVLTGGHTLTHIITVEEK